MPNRGRTLAVFNPTSGRLRRRHDDLRPLLRRLGDGAARPATNPAEVAEALDLLDPGADDVLLAVGGDGTIQALLTALHDRTPAGCWPSLVPVPAGSTNMTAADLGVSGTLARNVDRLVARLDAGERPGREEDRPLLRVESPGNRPLCGAFFGAGAISEGVRHFREHLREAGGGRAGTSWISLLRLLSLLLFDPRRVGALPVACRIDGEEVSDGNSLFCLVSVLDRLLFGARPYWGGGTGPIRYTGVRAFGSTPWTKLVRVARGRPGDSLTPEAGYVSRRAHRIELSFDGPFVVDGEVYEARAALGPVVLTSPRTVRWLCPA